jgi:hypothetical protein
VQRQTTLILTRLLFVSAIATIGTIGAVAADQSIGQSPVSAPKVVAVEKEFTFDEVLEGEIVTHAYVIENQGTAPLKILNVRTSCGCTTANRPDTIESGTSGQIEVKGDTRGYGGHVFEKTITVNTDDPLSPQLRLKLKGPVGLFARIEPTRIVLRGEIGTSLNAQATITPNPQHPFRIMEIVTDDRLADKIEVRMDQHGAQYLITVRNRLTTPGQYRGRIVIKTDSSLRPQLTLFINGQVMAKSAQL